MEEHIKKKFGGIHLTWLKLITAAVIAGIFTGLMALVPALHDTSFHTIAVTLEVWILFGILIIMNSRSNLDAALKCFVFFLISQPLVYLIQVPFNQQGWGLFGYYPYWFKITLLTLPAAFIAWFIKKDKWYSALILSGATVLLTLTGVSYLLQCLDTPPNHLISIIYCFATAIIFIFAILKKKSTRAICLSITAAAAAGYCLLVNLSKPYEAYNNSFIEESGIVFVGEPYVSSWSSTGGKGNVEIVSNAEGYVFKISGEGYKTYYFSVSDDENEYDFEYYFDKDQENVIVNLK